MPVCANVHSHCDPDGHEDRVQSRDPAPVGQDTPVMAGTHVCDATVANLSVALGAFNGLPESPIRDIRPDRVTVLSLDPDARAELPVMADRIRPLRHAGIAAEQAEIWPDGRRLTAPLDLTEATDEPA